MKKKQHSPRPWKWVPQNGDTLPRLEDAEGNVICAFGEAGSMDGWGEPPSEENQAVIEAAPDLLAALEDMVLNAPFHKQCANSLPIEVAKAAIAKARRKKKS